ncbi:MAG: AbiJ-NTD4 domain-containing protein [Pirellulales bacterium]
MRFSDRIGATQPVLNLQLDSMSPELRISLWNLLFKLYGHRSGNYWKEISSLVAVEFRKFPEDNLPHNPDGLGNWLKDYFFGLSWYDVYNFLEFIVNNHARVKREHRTIAGVCGVSPHPLPARTVENDINDILETEHSGYRFIAHVLSPISEQVELEEVQKAATELRGTGLDGARKHLQTALDLFSKRPNPDYRNAIKEAISAIESIARQVGGQSGNGLSPALRALEEKAGLHGALCSAFQKLYGYTSDERGIRHAMLEEDSPVGFEEAKYMIVACSAFANYLAAKAEKAGLLR